MDTSNSLFGKFSRLRKKHHQQPLTDLTDLYSKIANETIYYKKLENSKNYNKALQGWKALTTDALFQLTNINYAYPNTENYTIDELSILSGVRELYHKAQTHLDDLQKMLRDNPELSSRSNSKNKHHNTGISYHTRQYKNSLNRLQTTVSSPSISTSLHGFSKTTLRNDRGKFNKGQHSHSFNDYFSGSQRNHDVKVNFTNSKPLGNHLAHNDSFNDIANDNQSSISTLSNEHNPFGDFDDFNYDDDNRNIPSQLAIVDNDEIMNNSFDTSHISGLEESNDHTPNNENNDDDEVGYNTHSDSDDLDFDVSEYYEDNYETIENQNEEWSRNEYPPPSAASASSLIGNQDEYLFLDEEDKARLQALEKLNGSPNKYTDIDNSQLAQDLSHLSISPSKLSSNNKDNGETKSELESFIPPLPDKVPHPLPQLPRVPIIIPKQIMPEIKPQRHNLLNKNMTKNISAPSINTTAGTLQNSFNHINTDSCISKRPMVKSNKSTPIISTSGLSHSSNVKVKDRTTHKVLVKSNKVSPSKVPIKKKLTKHPKLNVESDGIKSNVSASQVAKLVYKTSTRNGASISSKNLKSTSSSPGGVISNKASLENSKKKMMLNKKSDTNRNLSTVKKNDQIKHKKIAGGTKTSNLGSSSSSKLQSHSNIKYTVPSNETKNKSSSSISSKARTLPVNRTTGQPSKNVSSPVKSSRSKQSFKSGTEKIGDDLDPDNSKVNEDNGNEDEDEYDKILKTIPNVDKVLGKQILQDIVVHGDEVHWDDIAGLNSAKNSLKEAVVYPFLRPDLFMGLRQPVTGMLLFGPPGTGKTMLARAVACESKSTFFSISASSLTSKYLGESEKLVRALFTIARKMSPSIIFVDEIDSILGSRNQDGENESSRRIKNEFLIQWSALSNAAAGKIDKRGSKFIDDKRVLVLAATNLPWSIDEAARRRFVRRQYIPLPEDETRLVQIKKLLAHQKHTLTDKDFITLIELTRGYSGSDITSLAKDAAMGPLRELGDQLLHTERENIRPIELKDFKNSLEYIKPSVSKEGLEKYEEWASQFGSSGT